MFEERPGAPAARLRPAIDRLQIRLSRASGSNATHAQELREFIQTLRAVNDSGIRELKSGDFYDSFRASLYRGTSIPEQLRAREFFRAVIQGVAEDSEG